MHNIYHYYYGTTKKDKINVHYSKKIMTFVVNVYDIYSKNL